ncbi:MAG: C40 family peptidase [Erysipelotrichaceae bacterium]|nr:C40 family peptidase [Erysipelotrichaceae bacterium]
MKTLSKKSSLKKRINSIKKTLLVLTLCLVGIQAVGFDKADRIPPVINSSKVWLPYGETLTGEDLNVTDDSGVDDMINITIDEGDYNSGVLGLYEVYVTASDWMKNSTEKVVEVEVYDAYPPVMAIKDEDATIQVEAGTDFVYGDYISAIDDVDGDVSDQITGDDVDTKKLGGQVIKAKVRDNAGNMTEEEYAIDVEDTVAPVFKFKKGKNAKVGYQAKFDLDDYVDMVDAGDDNATMTVEGDVDTSTLGKVSKLKLTGVDASGNISEETLKVTCADLTAPKLKLKYASATVEMNSTFNPQEFVAKAKDDVDGDLTKKVTTDGVVDTSQSGQYTVTFVVSDKAGNKTTATLDIEVVDDIKATGLINTAKTKLGHAYVWGATGPNVFDCSGFTRWVFAQNGISLPRTAAAQYSATKRVSRGDLRKGDLIFFKGTTGRGGITHVGIYIGDGQFIHAANSGISYNNLSESYYSAHYAGGGRR